MSETANRVVVAAGLILLAFFAAWLERHGVSAVYWLSLIVGVWMVFEFLSCLWKAPRDIMFNGKNLVLFVGFLALLGVDFVSLMTIGRRPMIIFMILVVVCAADIGAWFFGNLLGGDKMWERVSPNKTWSGQIAGVICGTAASILYGLLGTDTFLPQLLWIGISVSLLSQYGDLTTSWIKRHLKLKDFGNIIPGHGGFLDRFDGWIYALPLIWFIMM